VLFAMPEDATVAIDLASQTLRLPDGRQVEFPIDAFSRRCLLGGIDELGYIQQQDAAIAAYEAGRSAPVNTLA
jgi:3-isopropylmalate/(R)-2-methylmalate dehydratase small subunit